MTQAKQMGICQKCNDFKVLFENQTCEECSKKEI